MTKRCDVLVTYCWNRVGYAILRSLASHGLKAWAADTSKINICSLSRFCAGSFTYPDPFKEEKRFIETLKTKVAELRPRVLMPTHDESVVIMRHRDEFPSDLVIPYESADKLLALANKAVSTEMAREAGVAVPKVYSSADEVKRYPVVLKTVIGNSAKGVFFPKTKDELLRLMDAHKGEEMLLEEWIGGTDYSVDCVRWDGFCKTSVYHALVTKTDGGGTTTQREMVDMPRLETEAMKLLEAVDFHGVCGLDFRYDPETGRVAYIETNARFTGGLATPVAAGFDMPWVLYSLAIAGRYDNPIDVRIGTRTKWVLGDAITLVGRLLSLRWSAKEMRRVFSLRGFDGFDDFRRDDINAFLGEAFYYLAKLVKNRKLNP